MKLYIPEIGDEITLKSDWTFELHAENRNQDLALFNNHLYMILKKIRVKMNVFIAGNLMKENN